MAVVNAINTEALLAGVASIFWAGGAYWAFLIGLNLLRRLLSEAAE